MQPLLIRTAAPSVAPISLDDVYANSKIDYDDEDQALYEIIAFVIDRLDGPQGLLGRALITQSWKALYPCFPSEIVVPLARCQTVNSITYLDPSGVTQTLAPSAYRATGLLTDDARVRPVTGAAWPSTLVDREAVVVTFTSGFGANPEDVPASIRHALLEMAADAYEHREAVAAMARGEKFELVPASAYSAVMDWKCYPVEDRETPWHVTSWWR